MEIETQSYQTLDAALLYKGAEQYSFKTDNGTVTVKPIVVIGIGYCLPAVEEINTGVVHWYVVDKMSLSRDNFICQYQLQQMAVLARIHTEQYASDMNKSFTKTQASHQN